MKRWKRFYETDVRKMGQILLGTLGVLLLGTGVFCDIIGDAKGEDSKNLTDFQNEYDACWHLDAIHGKELWQALDAYGEKPGKDVIVAVLDTGVDVEHPDLKDNLWTNQAEAKGEPGVDDDHNGYVDDIYGVNLVNSYTDMTDQSGHGTMMAGVIGMTVGNGGGIGVAYGAKIMPVKVSTMGSNYSPVKVAEGIRYAVSNGADIINLSFGGPYPNAELREAILEAEKSCILVAAAGNEGYGTSDRQVMETKETIDTYPAAYDGVLGVMSYGLDGELNFSEDSFFSNVDTDPGRGVEYEIVAPGEKIYSTTKQGGFRTSSGTSQATASVSGALAIYVGMRKGENKDTPLQIKEDFLELMQGSISKEFTETSSGKKVLCQWKRLDLADLISEVNRLYPKASLAPSEKPVVPTKSPGPSGEHVVPTKSPGPSGEPIAPTKTPIPKKTEAPPQKEVEKEKAKKLKIKKLKKWQKLSPKISKKKNSKKGKIKFCFSLKKAKGFVLYTFDKKKKRYTKLKTTKKNYIYLSTKKNMKLVFEDIEKKKRKYGTAKRVK